MSTIRPAAVAGTFYPVDPGELKMRIDGLLRAAAALVAPRDPVPKAIIAPHAGYVYSGAVAASAYVRLLPAAGVISRVVLMGPCHRVAVRGLALPSAAAFASPLGTVPIDSMATACLQSLPHVIVSDDAHAIEHSLEVQLPFLQRLIPTFTLVPLAVGDAAAADVAEVLERLWGGRETLIVVSSDLSHYLPYHAARTLDAATCEAIERLDPAAIGFDQACGRIPIGGLLVAAKRHGLGVRTLDVRNSGDTAGDQSRVVGYGAWMFVEPGADGRQRETAVAEGVTEGGATAAVAHTEALLSRHGETLVHLAAASITHGLRCGVAMPVSDGEHPADLREPGASFVTLRRNGQLRGCVGSVQVHTSLAADVAQNGFAAAFRDSRFPPLTRDELAGLTISVSVLTPPSPIRCREERELLDQLQPGADGLIIDFGAHRALFLPQVWEQVPCPRDFLELLKRKAGLPATFWSEEVKAWRFTARSISCEQLAEPAALWQ